MADKKAAKHKLHVDLRLQIDRLAGMKKWDIEGWTPENNAVVIVRTILTIIGEKELMDDSPESKEERRALCDAILPILKSGASINFERDVLIPLAISPRKMGKGGEKPDRLGDA